QAEDGIRDATVTGVQTCALPILDIAVIGISGIEPDGSLRDFDYREVKVAQAIIAHAREVWLAADSSKFNRPAMVELAQLSQIDRSEERRVGKECKSRWWQ